MTDAPDRKRRGLTEEDRFHIAVADFLALVLKPPAVWSTFPAGGGGAARGARLKRMGLKAGWPDILIVHEGRVFGLELKTPTGRRKPSQVLMIPVLLDAGMRVVIARDLDTIQRQLREWGLPLRRTL